MLGQIISHYRILAKPAECRHGRAQSGRVVNAGTRTVDQRRLMVRVQSSTPANAMNSRESCFIISRIFLRSLFLENHRS